VTLFVVSVEDSVHDLCRRLLGHQGWLSAEEESYEEVIVSIDKVFSNGLVPKHCRTRVFRAGDSNL
jgi:hypothetical protein